MISAILLLENKLLGLSAGFFLGALNRLQDLFQAFYNLEPKYLELVQDLRGCAERNVSGPFLGILPRTHFCFKFIWCLSSSAEKVSGKSHEFF